MALQWRHNGRYSVSNHQPRDCLLNRLFSHRSKKTPKLRIAGLWAGNSPVTGEFLAQMAINAENNSIWWRHHEVPARNQYSEVWYHSILSMIILVNASKRAIFMFPYYYYPVIIPIIKPGTPMYDILISRAKCWLSYFIYKYGRKHWTKHFCNTKMCLTWINWNTLWNMLKDKAICPFFKYAISEYILPSDATDTQCCMCLQIYVFHWFLIS